MAPYMCCEGLWSHAAARLQPLAHPVAQRPPVSVRNGSHVATVASFNQQAREVCSSGCASAQHLPKLTLMSIAVCELRGLSQEMRTSWCRTRRAN